MSLLWTMPAAFIGLVLIALPIVIHLFVRQHVRSLPYPSLRFLRETQLASFRHRHIEDAALLASRAGIIAAAAAALAGPILVTSSRLEGAASRLSRAVVVAGDVPDEIISGQRDAFRFERFRRATINDALEDAARWLDAQPRSAREVVIAGPLRQGDLAPTDLAVLAPGVGVRFIQTPSTQPAVQAFAVLAWRDGALHRIDRIARLTAGTTGIAEEHVAPAADDLVTILAKPGEMPLATASLRAALSGGVPWRDFDRRVVIVWPGADEFSNSTRLATAVVLRMPVPAPTFAAADVVRAALEEAGAPAWIEPETIPAVQLDAWSRRPGPPAANAPISEGDDRRWLWGLSLALLMVEQWMRRSRATRSGTAASTEEARVA